MEELEGLFEKQSGWSLLPADYALANLWLICPDWVVRRVNFAQVNFARQPSAVSLQD